MSKRQKGRKHRTVNRTPRPRGPAGPRTPESTSPAATGGPATASTSAPAAAPGTEPASGHAPDAAHPASGETYGPVFTSPAREGGLGRPAARTWEALAETGEHGCTAEELSSAAGFTAATVRKHLTGLARYGLAERRDDRWFRTGKSQWDAVPEDHSAPAAPS